jgi:hypothetical protein
VRRTCYIHVSGIRIWTIRGLGEIVMRTQLHLTGDAKTLEALSRFLAALETMQPAPISQPKAVCGEDNVIYVEVGYHTEEDTLLAGEQMAPVGAQIVEETEVLVALAPFVAEKTREGAVNEDG